MEKYAIIMAGGTGTRLWPLSRAKRPKQFIEVEPGSCMLQTTISRITELVPAERCYIITNESLFEITAQTVRGRIPCENIITEPMRKNTAACISYAALTLRRRVGDGIYCFVPADGYVKNRADYKATLQKAFERAEATDSLVIIGIEPTYPATGYGYIRMGEASKDSPYFSVREFVEKPKLHKARRYLASGKYLWNSGIVLGSANAIIKNVEACLPAHFEALSRAVGTGQEDGTISVREAFHALEDVSFDNGVLEKAGSIEGVKGSFDWDDLGSLDAFAQIFEADAAGNASRGDFFGVDTRDTVAYSSGPLVSAVGVEGLIIAVTKDAVLVCPKNKVQDIKRLVALLREKGYDTLL